MIEKAYLSEFNSLTNNIYSNSIINSNSNYNNRETFDFLKKNKNISSNKLSITIQVFSNSFQTPFINYLLNMNSFLLDSFVYQRKMHRYYKAVTELEEKSLSEEEFEKIELSCVITLKNTTTRDLKDKIVYLYDSLNEKHPEEIEYMNNDDLADILAISKYNLKPLLEA